MTHSSRKSLIVSFLVGAIFSPLLLLLVANTFLPQINDGVTAELNPLAESTEMPMNVETANQSPRAQQVIKFFNALSPQSMELVTEFYATEVHFEDPLGSHHGLQEVQKYYSRLYRNVTDISFEFGPIVESGSTVAAPWVMHLKAQGLNKGRETQLHGLSYIRFNEQGKAIYHRDYFDMKEFIYRYVPVLNRIIAFVDKKLKGS